MKKLQNKKKKKNEKNLFLCIRDFSSSSSSTHLVGQCKKKKRINENTKSSYGVLFIFFKRVCVCIG